MTLLAIDTSVAVALLVETHAHHEVATQGCVGWKLALSGHALVETYSVLTRLPGDIRLHPQDAARLLQVRFEQPLHLSPEAARELPHTLARKDIAGGAVYDALVAMAALESKAVLATRDLRAKATYDAVGVRVQLIA